MGFSDIGCYGSEIATPNLDKLAAGGLRSTRFYNTGRCCPTRAPLLSGLYAHQAGIGQMTNDLGQPGYRGDLSLDAVTLAEVMICKTTADARRTGADARARIRRLGWCRWPKTSCKPGWCRTARAQDSRC